MSNFTVRVNYGGVFVQDYSTVTYVGGKITEFCGRVDSNTKYSDLLSVLGNVVGLNEVCKMFYRVPTKDLRDGLVMLYSDASVSEMFYYLEKVGSIDLYVEHVTLSAPPNASSVDESPVDLLHGEALSAESEDSYSSENGSFIDTSDEEKFEQASSIKGQFIRFKSNGLECPRFSVGMTFTGASEFRRAVTSYAIADKKDIKLAKNERIRVRAVCKWPGCPWTLFASIDAKSSHFMVKTYNPEHNCLPTFKCGKITSEYLANRYEERIKSQPSWKLKEMRATFREELEVEISRSKCRRAKLIVMKKFLGSYAAQYAQIWNYAEALLVSNPESTIIVKTDRVNEDSNPYFKRMYVCFDACKKGFKAGCRPVIGLDGSFSKGPVHFEILCAVGRDANNKMYPIAWAVVEIENREVWDWFLELLAQDLELGSGHGYVIITDQQKGLQKSIESLLPHAQHRMCARHIYGNWKKKHKGDELKKYFWMCAKSYTPSEYESNLELLKAESGQAAIDLLKTDPIHWCRAWFSDEIQCDIVDNNLSESFNSWILDARHKPIISMLEEIREMVMTRIQEQRGEAEKYEHAICPNILGILKENRKETKNCRLEWNGEDGYEISHRVMTDTLKVYRHVVDMRNLKCSCRVWTLTGVPCPHAIIAIFHQRKEPEDFVSSYYTKETNQKIYAHVLMPLAGAHDWPTTGCDIPNPPGKKKMPGRPKKHQRREQGVVVPKPVSTKVSRSGTIIRCRLCHKEGHNRTTCPKNSEKANNNKKKRREDSAQSALIDQ